MTQAVLVSSVVPYMLKTDDNPNGVPQATFDEMTAGMKKDFRNFFTGFFSDFYGVGVLMDKVSQEEKDWAWMTTMHASQYATLKSAAAFATTDFRPDLANFNDADAGDPRDQGRDRADRRDRSRGRQGGAERDDRRIRRRAARGVRHADRAPRNDIIVFLGQGGKTSATAEGGTVAQPA